MSALRKAQDNYQKKLEKAIAEATESASVDVAQYMCQILPTGGGAGLDNAQTPLNTPYAISYDVGTGLDLNALTSGGRSRTGLGNSINTEGAKAKILVTGGTKEVTSVFNRDTRICHVCTTTSVENCEKLVAKGTKVKKKNCTTDVQESCEDIQM